MGFRSVLPGGWCGLMLLGPLALAGLRVHPARYGGCAAITPLGLAASCRWPQRGLRVHPARYGDCAAITPLGLLCPAAGPSGAYACIRHAMAAAPLLRPLACAIKALALAGLTPRPAAMAAYAAITPLGLRHPGAGHSGAYACIRHAMAAAPPYAPWACGILPLAASVYLRRNWKG